jgi:endoglucanase
MPLASSLPGRRRNLLRHAFALAAIGAPRPAEAAPDAGWRLFRDRFVTASGRVLDGEATHSEGQAWALFLAARHGDRATFDLVLRWTREKLGRRGDALLAWRFDPASGMANDLNNAADADLFYAWALLVAAERWPGQRYRELALAVARDFLRSSIQMRAGRLLLLPAAAGFEQAGRTRLNLSYYVIPALRALAEALPHPAWRALVTDGVALLRAARFGAWGLPADWMDMDHASGRLSPGSGRGARFGFDAMRIPLYCVWGGLGAAPVVGASAAFWADPRHPYVPAWTDLGTDAISPFEAGVGVLAMARLAFAASGGARRRIPWPQACTATPYYETALLLLAQQAAVEVL